MSNEPLRVLQIMGTMNRGGAESLIMNIYRFIDKEIVQFDFVVHTDERCSFDDEIISLGGRIYHAPKYKLVNHYSYCKWWKEFFNTHREYKIVHSHIRSTASIIFRIAKEYRLSTISHSHSTSNGSGISSYIKNQLQTRITDYADYLVACSEEAGKWLYKSNKFIVLKNGVDLSKFSFNKSIRDEVRSSLGITDSTLVCGHVGRFHEAKNHEYLIDIFAEILKRNTNAVLLLVGDGPLRNHVQEKAEKLKISKSVKFLGVRDDIDKLLQAFDRFIFPSIWEGFPVSVIEAEAVGIPCIISDTITPEVLIVPNVRSLSILEPAYKWADEVIRNDCRLNNADAIKHAGYDIAQEVKEIQEFYKDIIYKSE